MKTVLATIGSLTALVVAFTACGGGGDDGSGGSAGSSATAGNTSGGTDNMSGSGGATAGSGATSGGGTTSGGSASGAGGAGTSGAGGGASDAVCSPGMTIEAAAAYPDPLQNCGFDGKGELMGVQGFYRSIKLPKPIGPGDKFSFSVDLGALGGGTMELWGGTAECGEAHEHFATATLPDGGGKGSRCMTAAPKTGTYPYLIWVLHTAGAHGDVTLCPDVSCPGQ